MSHPSSWHTIFFVVTFASAYLFHLVRKTLREQIDLYDLLMLSLVAILPAMLVIWPELGEAAAGWFGVAYPFVVLFGVLFAALFVFVHRLSAKMHKVENDSRVLVQELSLLLSRQSAPFGPPDTHERSHGSPD